MQYKLFKKFNILSDRILREDNLRAARHTSGNDSSGDFETGPSKKKKKGKKNKTHSTFVVDKPSDRPIGIRIHELLVY